MLVESSGTFTRRAMKFSGSWAQLGFREDLAVRNWFGVIFKSYELAYEFVDWI